jgi:RNA polymerase sigma factor (sigma-70 family)
MEEDVDRPSPAGRDAEKLMSPETTRPSLLSRVRDVTDHAAWAEFDSRYRELLFRYCRRRGLSATDAEDVRQMVMLRLVQAMPRFHYDPAVGRFHDFLYRIARNVIADFRDCPNPAARTVVNDKTLTCLADCADEPDGEWEQEWLDHHLRLALDAVRQTCDPRSVAAFERLMNGATIEQVAMEFVMNYDAVQKSTRRMRERIQQRIAEQIREEDAPD